LTANIYIIYIVNLMSISICDPSEKQTKKTTKKKKIKNKKIKKKKQQPKPG